MPTIPSSADGARWAATRLRRCSPAVELLTPQHGADRAAEIGLVLYMAYNVTAAAVSVPGGQLGDRRGTLLVLTTGVACFGASYLGFALTGASIAILAVCFVAAGAGIGFVETAEHAAVATHASEELRGSAFGALASVQSLGNFGASLVAGLLWTAVSPRVAFLYLVAWMIVALIAFVVVGRDDKRGRSVSAATAG